MTRGKTLRPVTLPRIANLTHNDIALQTLDTQRRYLDHIAQQARRICDAACDAAYEPAFDTAAQPRSNFELNVSIHNVSRDSATTNSNASAGIASTPRSEETNNRISQSGDTHQIGTSVWRSTDTSGTQWHTPELEALKLEVAELKSALCAIQSLLSSHISEHHSGQPARKLILKRKGGEEAC